MLGPELIENGNFNGNAAGWGGQGWSYGDHNIIYNFGGIASVDIINPGSGFETSPGFGSYITTGGSGTGAIVFCETFEGTVDIATFFLDSDPTNTVNSGFNYLVEDTLNIIGGDDNASIQVTELYDDPETDQNFVAASITDDSIIIGHTYRVSFDFDGSGEDVSGLWNLGGLTEEPIIVTIGHYEQDIVAYTTGDICNSFVFYLQGGANEGSLTNVSIREVVNSSPILARPINPTAI